MFCWVDVYIDKYFFCRYQLLQLVLSHFIYFLPNFMAAKIFFCISLEESLFDDLLNPWRLSRSWNKSLDNLNWYGFSMQMLAIGDVMVIITMHYWSHQQGEPRIRFRDSLKFSKWLDGASGRKRPLAPASTTRLDSIDFLTSAST